MVKEIAAVVEERIQQNKKWGVQDHDDSYWLAILVEEVGEVAKDMQEGRDPRLEITQVAAVAVAWLEAANRRIRGSAS